MSQLANMATPIVDPLEGGGGKEATGTLKSVILLVGVGYDLFVEQDGQFEVKQFQAF